MEHFGMTECAASNQLQRLCRSGCVRREGTTRHPTWYATDKRPEDRRGHNTASLHGLRKGWNSWLDGLTAAFVARGRDPKKIGSRKPKPERYQPATELERCWLMPNSRTQSNDDVADSAAEEYVRKNREAA